MIDLLASPWVEGFERLLGQVSSSLLLCSPFVARGPCDRVAAALSRGGRRTVSLLVLTDLSRDNMLSGATDVAALLELSRALPQTEVRFLPNLHAKVYIADERCAVITSGNLTDSGLLTNLEYGLCLSDHDMVKRIRADIMQYALMGSKIDAGQLGVFGQIVAELKEIKAKADRSLRTRLRREFDLKLRAADQEILQARAESLSAHAAFADTILFILSRGPATTQRIYSEVQRIHPDLCDDSIKLIIRGEAWSQVKWHHRVRHAQLYLRRQGQIRREGNKWRLAD